MLSEFMEKALEMGCDEIEIEYKDRHELITAFQGSFGIGIGSVISREAAPLFDEIKELKRKKRVTIRRRSRKLTLWCSEKLPPEMRSVMWQKVGGAERLGMVCADFEIDGYPTTTQAAYRSSEPPPEASVPHRPHG